MIKFSRLEGSAFHSVLVLRDGSSVSLDPLMYGLPPVGSQKSHPYLPLNCFVFLRKAPATESDEQTDA